MDNEMSNVDWVEMIHVVMVKTVVEVEDCCKTTDKTDKKGLKRQKEAKTIKNRQETGKRQRDKSKSEESARDHSRISPTQQEMKSRVKLKVKGPRLTSVQSFKVEYGVSNPSEYGVSSSLSNTAYSSQQINMAYPLPLDTAYRSSGTETKIIDFYFNLLSDKEYSQEEEEEAMAETMEQYMSKTRTDYGSGVTMPKIDNKDQFELKGQFVKELRENTFSVSDNEDANEHIEKFLEIVDLFHVPNITFLNKYCPRGRTAKKMEEINNFQQEPDETLYQAWERFKELLMKCPQHYLTKMQEMPKQPSKKWLNTLKNGTMEHQEEEVLRLLTD
ncbi:hypothetical protein Tco_1030198 [Tanacetum coccineum]|uniref:Retrotransposon gag domain-containing protein n=1 Tax=Tanacetum coccineum TaxID=301880 RepID=A0ABQ5G7S9_9ASTR